MDLRAIFRALFGRVLLWLIKCIIACLPFKGHCAGRRAFFPDPPLSLASLPPRLKSLSEKWHPLQQSQAPFYKLPTELRQEILREAFGDRTLHLDVRSRTSMHELRVRRGNPLKMHRPGARGWRRLVPWFYPKTYRHGFHSNESLEELPVWRWDGCFCHGGLVSWTNREHLFDILHSGDPEPLFSDGCWRGRAWCCSPAHVTATLPDHARVGAMGFLLSCKQA